ncbi:bifunctional biotin--[acetyl-CoA-carboxylase] ligase/biotin operon repressor BirA [Shewanella sp. HL-SH8]|uniref:bifunctional biotin--[acetyl-CoA-carboxylase] ligase/biotin operon repressor BirA n=1 Tax=unclassified Shewanella TaxID=196818 RepID=UPI003EBA4585
MNEHWSRKRSILSLLSAEHFTSGEKIASQISLTRMAVNQHIDSLSEYGVEIFSVKGKGYKLANPIALVDENRLINQIDNRCFYFDEINSTNSFLLSHHEDLKSGDICVAEYQSAGRGRRGRQWQSPYGNHLYASLFWRFDSDVTKAMGLSLVIACSIVKALTDMGVTGLGLKWPNDIYLEGKKLAGILIEVAQTNAQQTELVIGFGINMSMSAVQGELIDQPWSDLTSQNQLPDKTLLLAKLHQHLKSDIQLFDKQGLVPFIDFWQQYDLFTDKPIKLLMAPNEVEGVYKGIDQQGGIIIDTNEGLKTFIGGEISLRRA